MRPTGFATRDEPAWLSVVKSRQTGISDRSHEADGVVNALEAAGGATLSGTAEPGSDVVVQLGNVRHPVTVDANGDRSVGLAV
jgi:hypothetical protein